VLRTRGRGNLLELVRVINAVGPALHGRAAQGLARQVAKDVKAVAFLLRWRAVAHRLEAVERVVAVALVVDAARQGVGAGGAVAPDVVAVGVLGQLGCLHIADLAARAQGLGHVHDAAQAAFGQPVVLRAQPCAGVALNQAASGVQREGDGLVVGRHNGRGPPHRVIFVVPLVGDRGWCAARVLERDLGQAPARRPFVAQGLVASAVCDAAQAVRVFKERELEFDVAKCCACVLNRCICTPPVGTTT
jgi:hypothetical protein